MFIQLKIAIRNAFKNKSVAILNITNLSIGLASAIAVYVVLWGAVHMDTFHKKIDQLYKIKGYSTNTSERYVSGATSVFLAEAVKNDVPEIIETCRTMEYGDEELIGFVDNNLKKKGVFVDPSFFTMFSYSLKSGNPETALEAPNNIVISEKMAEKLFPNENAINQTLNIYSINKDNPEVFTVKGILQTAVQPSIFKFDYLLPIQNYINNNPGVESWNNIGIRTYVLLHPRANTSGVNPKITNVLKSKKATDDQVREMYLEPFKNSHLYAGGKTPYTYGPSLYVLIIIGIIGLLILLVSVINFVNLTTAWSINRAKEVGVRKVTGAGRSTLVRQFFNETAIIVVTSTFIALLLCSAAMNQIGRVMQMEMGLPLNNLWFLVGIVSIMLLTTVLAGWSPARILSRFKPVTVLKNSIGTSNNTKAIRQTLVVIQFVLAIFLIISTITLKNQVEFIKKDAHGYDRFHVVMFKNNQNLKKNREAFSNGLNGKEGIKHFTFSSQLPINVIYSRNDVEWDGKNPQDRSYYATIDVDKNFCNTLGIKIKSGSSFKDEVNSDRRIILINDTAAQYMNMAHPVGEIVRMGGQDYEIKGVVQNFQFHNMIGSVAPLFIRYNPGNTNWCMVKLDPEVPEAGLASLQEVYSTYAPDFPFDYTFLDTEYNEMHTMLFSIIIILYFSAGFAILIACLGLLGLTLFITSRKVKEIGVRKVNGAKTINILTLILNQFVRQVLIAFILAAPVAYLLINKLLQVFTYKEPMGWEVFGLTLLYVMLLVLLTVGWHSWRTASRNPVEALRYE